MKTKKLIKKAFKHPEFHTWADLMFFHKWLEAKKAKKEQKKKEKSQ